MEWIKFAIWFGCGFACREVIWQQQKRRAEIEWNRVKKEIQPMLKEITELQQHLKETENGDNQHSK